jgi:hypothetical protein
VRRQVKRPLRERTLPALVFGLGSFAWHTALLLLLLQLFGRRRWPIDVWLFSAVLPGLFAGLWGLTLGFRTIRKTTTAAIAWGAATGALTFLAYAVLAVPAALIGMALLHINPATHAAAMMLVWAPAPFGIPELLGQAMAGALAGWLVHPRVRS